MALAFVQHRMQHLFRRLVSQIHLEAGKRKRPCSLWKHKLPSGRISWSVRFRQDDGSWSVAKASGHATRLEAEASAIDYPGTGQIVARENITVKDIATQYFA